MPKQSTVDFLDDEIVRLDAENKRLRAALAPFAAVADEYAEQEDDTHEVWIDAGPEKLIRASFRLGLYRAARAALSLQPQN